MWLTCHYNRNINQLLKQKSGILGFKTGCNDTGLSVIPWRERCPQRYQSCTGSGRWALNNGCFNIPVIPNQQSSRDILLRFTWFWELIFLAPMFGSAPLYLKHSSEGRCSTAQFSTFCFSYRNLLPRTSITARSSISPIDLSVFLRV